MSMTGAAARPCLILVKWEEIKRSREVLEKPLKLRGASELANVCTDALKRQFCRSKQELKLLGVNIYSCVYYCAAMQLCRWILRINSGLITCAEVYVDSLEHQESSV